MIKYLSTALTFKLFSINKFTRDLYRTIGNIFGPKRRMNQNLASYIQRGSLMIELVNKYNMIHENSSCFELGTGWLHFYSIYLNLFYNTQITMLDIWDNRQLIALKSVFSRLKNEDQKIKLQNNKRANSLLNHLEKCNSYSEVYDLFNLKYLIEPTGSLSHVKDNSIDLIFSFHVLEHVPSNDTNVLIEDFNRILKPGGYSLHQIGLDDHLSHYDRKESPKKYLSYSDRTWKIFFENQIQYFNRLPLNSWLEMFNNKQFLLLEKIIETTNIDKLRIHENYNYQTVEEIEATTVTILHQKVS